MPTSQRQTSSYIPGLDGLRAISIFFVVTSHAGSRAWFPDGDLGNRLFALVSGGTGVNFFFVISGYLISRLLLQELKATGKLNLFNFYLRRLLRLAPALILYLLTCFGLMKANVIANSSAALLGGAIYLYNFLPKFFMTSETAHLWSLSVEEQFYLMWPLVLAFFFNRALGLAIIGIVGGAWLYIKPLNFVLDLKNDFIAALVNLSGKNPYDYSNYLVEGRYFNFSQILYVEHLPLPAMSLIFVGCLAALTEGHLKKFIVRMPWKLLGAGILLYLCSLYLVPGLMELQQLVQCLGCGLIILYVASHPRSRLVSALEFAPLRYLGRLSYGIYLWHGLFIGTDLVKTDPFQKFPINIVMTLTAAVVSYHIVELKFLRLRDQLRR